MSKEKASGSEVHDKKKKKMCVPTNVGCQCDGRHLQSTHQSCANIDWRKQEMRGQLIRKTREEDSVGAEEKEMRDEVADLNLFIFCIVDYLM